jgi:hypothetical protein
MYFIQYSVCYAAYQIRRRFNVIGFFKMSLLNKAIKRILVWQSKAGFYGIFLGFIEMRIVMALHNV